MSGGFFNDLSRWQFQLQEAFDKSKNVYTSLNLSRAKFRAQFPQNQLPLCDQHSIGLYVNLDNTIQDQESDATMQLQVLYAVGAVPGIHNIKEGVGPVARMFKTVRGP